MRAAWPEQGDCSALLVSQLSHVAASAWNALVPSWAPCLQHTFLHGLEQTGCASAERGWQPLHLLILGPQGVSAFAGWPQALPASADSALVGRPLLAAVPLYARGDSWGEFIFDFGWADLARRLGVAWYPKLVSAVPFTPVNAPKLLVHPSLDDAEGQRRLLAALRAVQTQQGWTSLQLLFQPPQEAEVAAEQGFLHRHSLQAVWENHGYATFDDFLHTLRHDARKNIRRERRRAQELGLALSVERGDALDDDAWAAVYRHYLAGVDKHHSEPYLTESFFVWIRQHMPHNVVCSVARRDGKVVASTLNFCGGKRLFGRYWGAEQDFPYLHFELCFYALIEWAIASGIERFEPGAGTGHKFGRGLSPQVVHASYQVAEPRLAAILQRYVAQERTQVAESADHVRLHGALRRDDPAAT